MAGLYRRGVQRNAGTPMMQVQGSQGAGGAIPRGASLPAASQDNAKTSENVQKLGGLLGMLNQQKQAQEEIAPAMGAAEQAQSNVNALPNPAFGMQYAPSASTDGSWGGVQASAFGPGVPTSDGNWGGAANGAVPNFAAGAGLELPGMGSTAPAGAMTGFGGGIPGAAANTAGQAGSALQLSGEFNPANFFDLFSMGGGAGA